MIKRLAALAEAATPGPWYWTNHELHSLPLAEKFNHAKASREVPVDSTISWLWSPEEIIQTDSGYYNPNEADAAYIAAASPDVILNLIHQIRILEELRDLSQ